MRKLIMLFLIVFIYEKSFSQTCKEEDPNALVDFPTQLGELLERGFKGMSGEINAEMYGKKIGWGTINNPYLGINMQINYNYEVAGFRELAQKYTTIINWAIKKIADQDARMIEKLKERPLEFYLIGQEFGTGLKENDYTTPWIKVTHLTDFFRVGAASVTHFSNWSRVNKIIVNATKCGPNENGVVAILHSLGHILNEDFIGQHQYWGTRSFYNTQNIQRGANSRYVLEQTELSGKIDNLATVTRKCFVAEVFNNLVNGKEGSMINKDQNNRDNILRQIKARYEWLGGPPVKWNIR